MSETDIQIRSLADDQEKLTLIRLQEATWRDDAPHNLTMLHAAEQNGGVVLGAFDGEDLIGGSVAFWEAMGDDDPAEAKLNSELLVVDERYRNQGIGYHLKLAQYVFCQQQDIRLVTWGFDPLHSVAAHLAIRKLGGVVSEDNLVTGGTGEQPYSLQVNWWLTSNRVRQRLTNGRAPLVLERYLEAEVPILNPTRLNKANLAEPSSDYKQLTGALGLIEIPARFSHLVESDPLLAQAWQEHGRALFGAILADGFILTDFIHTSYQGRRRSFYVCSLGSRLREFDRSFNQN